MTIPIELLAAVLSVLLFAILKSYQRIERRLNGLEKRFLAVTFALQEHLGIEISGDTDHLHIRAPKQ